MHALRSSDDADRLLRAVSCHPTARCARIEIPPSASPIASALALMVVGLLAGPFLVLTLILLQACFVGNDSPPKMELAVSGAIATLLTVLFLFVLKRLRPSIVSLGTDGVRVSVAQSLSLSFDQVSDVVTTASEIVLVLNDGRYARIPSNGTPGAAVMRRLAELRRSQSRPRELAAVGARLGRGDSRVPAWRARLEAVDDIPATYRDPLLSTATLTAIACAAEYPDDVRTGAAFLLARRRAQEGLRRVAVAVGASVRPKFRRQLEAAAAGFLKTSSSHRRGRPTT